MKPSMNWFFVFVPVAVVLEHVEGVPVPLIFFSAALAILPIASIIVQATEQVALRVGDTVGGLLNATFGNAPELIISIVALRAGLFDMVRASLAGAVLANLLLALGVAFLLGGIRYHEQEYNPVASRLYSTMMLLAVISLSIPSGFRRLLGGDEPMAYEQSLNLGLDERNTRWCCRGNGEVPRHVRHVHQHHLFGHCRRCSRERFSDCYSAQKQGRSEHSERREDDSNLLQ